MGILTSNIPEGYILGLGRDFPHPKTAHLYKGDFADPGLPMCRNGWNRDDGQSYSIWRGNMGESGVCKVCLRRARAGLDGVEAKVPA
jgi:hypothetical protein